MMSTFSGDARFRRPRRAFMADAALTSAIELAAKNKSHFPNESPAYREARNKLLAEEIELRRHLERVAEQRRSLPLGGVIPEDYELVSDHGPVKFSDLFGDKDTLVVYSMMYGPQRARPCPMCTAVMTSWDGAARNVNDRVSLVVFARSPIERLLAFKEERGWRNLQLVSDMTGNYTRAYVTPDDGDVPGLNIFVKRDNAIHHFWSGEFNFDMADPGQDPRSAPELDPLWTILDLTPGGRGKDWYPKLEYGPAPLVQLV
jgi:predicted dithiol-disulfide oxidoreductase (DUF899 family)